MTNKEAKDYLLNVSYMIGTTAVEYMTQKDGDKIREAIEALTVPSAEPEIVYCEDCKYADEKRIADGRHWCNLNNGYLSYCSEGERRTDERPNQQTSGD